MKTAARSRIPYISTARVIGILLVVLGHSYPFDVPIPRSLDLLRNFIYTFHMPLFILISGYLAAGSSRSAGNFIANRAKKLLLPYFILSLVAFLPKALVQQYLNDSVSFSFSYLLRSELVPRENVWGHFWFLPVLFFLNVFSALMRKPLKRRNIRVFILASAYLLLWLPETTDWFALEDLRKNLFWYVLGYLLADLHSFEKIIKNKLLLLGLPAAILLFLLPIDLQIVGTLLTISAILCLGTMINIERHLLMRTIERYSFTIFLLSWPFQAVVEVVLNKLLHLPVCISMIGMFTAGMVGPMICICILNWIEKYLPMRWLKPILGI